MRKILCWIKAIPFFVNSGIWIPHVYVADYEKAIIIASRHGFRVSDNYQHSPEETVHKDACLIRYKCLHCGHEEFSWYRSWNERWRLDI